MFSFIKMFRLALLCALLVSVYGDTTPVNRCTRAGELPLHTYVTGCQSLPCQLPQLTYADINIIFRAPRTIRSMNTLAYASLLLGSFEAPAISYNLGEAAVACNYITNTYCPLMEGEVVSYNLQMYIEPFFPVGTLANVEFVVVDQDSNPVLCLRMQIQILRAQSSNMITNSAEQNNGTLNVV